MLLSCALQAGVRMYAIAPEPLAVARFARDTQRVDLRDLLDPDRDARFDGDLAVVEGALDALPKLADARVRLPPTKRAEYTGRWLERMLTLESLPGRLYRGGPTLLQQARYGRIADRAREQGAVMQSLGLHYPRLQ